MSSKKTKRHYLHFSAEMEELARLYNITELIPFHPKDTYQGVQERIGILKINAKAQDFDRYVRAREQR